MQANILLSLQNITKSNCFIVTNTYWGREFFNLFFRIAKTIDSSHELQPDQTFLIDKLSSMTNGDLSIVENIQDSNMKPLDALLVDIFNLFKQSNLLLKKDKEIEFIYSSDLIEMFKLKKNTSFDNSFAGITQKPKTLTDFIADYESMIESSKSPVCEKVFLDLLKIVLSEELNAEHNEFLHNSFMSVFNDMSEYNKDTFYSFPRKLDCSGFGDLDMALHAVLNGSDIIPALIKHYNKLD